MPRLEQRDRHHAQRMVNVPGLIVPMCVRRALETGIAAALKREREDAYSAGYSAGHEDQMKMRIRDLKDIREGRMKP